MLESPVFLHYDGVNKLPKKTQSTALSAVAKKGWRKRKSAAGYRMSLVAQQPSRPKNQENPPKDPLEKEDSLRLSSTSRTQRNPKRKMTESKTINEISQPAVFIASQEIFHAIDDSLHRVFHYRLYGWYPDGGCSQLKLAAARSSIPYATKGHQSNGGTFNPLPIDKRPFPVNCCYFNNAFIWGFKNGILAFKNGDMRRANASFTQALHCLEDLLYCECTANWDDFFEVLICIKKHNVPELGHWLLRYISSKPAKTHLRRNAYVVAARNLLQIIDLDGALEATFRLISDKTTEILGIEDEFSLDTRMEFVTKCFRMRNDPCVIQDATAAYHTFGVETDAYSTAPRLVRQNLEYSYAEILANFEQWATIESVLSGALDELQEYMTMGYKPGCGDDAAPIRITMIIRRLVFLGDAFASQEKFESARYTYSQAAAAGMRYLYKNDPTSIDAIARLASFFASQNLNTDSEAIFNMFDERMEAFME